MDLKREQIKKIKANSTLSEQEKNRQIQQLMMGNFLSVINNEKPNRSKTCPHYEKQCYNFYFDCCKTWDPCKRCHGERNCLNKDNLVVCQITCSVCETTQEPGENCSNPDCAIKFANSYCGICYIWTSKDINHCEKCGICRIGTKETLIHCDDCGICFVNSGSLTGSDSTQSHNCVKINMRKSQTNKSNGKINLKPDYKDGICVICSENTFNSQSESFPLDCGHFVHKNCFNQFVNSGNYKCPCCRKSIGDLRAQWDFIRTQIKLHPLPNDFLPIQVSDIVDTSYGKFKVHSIDEQVTGTKLYSGEFLSWYTNSNKTINVTGTLNSQSVKKNLYKNIHCNDCEQKSSSIYHPYGFECGLCGSFNTQE